MTARRWILACALCAILLFNDSKSSLNGTISAREVYRSNAVGVIIDTLPDETPTTAPGYLLVVDKDGENRTESLYRDGKLIRQTDSVTINRTRTESTYRSGTITEQNTYDSSSRLLSAITYDEDGKQQKSVRYTHQPNGIIAERFDSNGELFFREQQEIDQNKRVTRIEREYADGSMEEVRFIFLDRRLLREIHRLDNLELTLRYDPLGRIIREEHRFDEQLKKEIDYSYGKERTDRIPDTTFTTERDGELTTRIELTNNIQGQAVERFSYENDILVEDAFFTYRDGNLRSTRIHRTGSTSQQELIYNQTGEKIEERWYENGALIRSVVPGTEGSGETVELRYANGVSYVRIFFKNGVRIREEFLTNNNVIRERALE